MKNTFPGYNRKTEDELKSLWKKGVICFDANVLLNLYRYSKETRNTLLGLIERFKDRIWLPHQAALEYNRNRYEVIADQEKAYNDFIAKIDQIQQDLQSSSKPPFLSENVHTSLKNEFKKVKKEVNFSIQMYSEFLKKDPIYEKIVELFDMKISEKYDPDKLDEIYKEGEERYSQKIPPGYEDEKNKDGTRKYGDLVLWKQIIDKAKEEKVPILLITDERKTDWWWKIKDGRNMGPRQELVEEMKIESHADFHMYSSEKFLSYGQRHLDEQINEKALQEIQEMKRAEIDNMRIKQKIENFNNKRKELRLRSMEEFKYLEDRYITVENKIKSIRNQMHHLERDARENSDIQEYIHSNSIHIDELMNEREMLRERMNNLIAKTEDTSIRKFINKEYYKKDFDEDNN